MTRRKAILLALAVSALLVAAGAGYLALRGRSDKAAPAKAATADKGRLVFAADASQLNFVRLDNPKPWPMPASEPLNARITVAEDLTARITSPVAGRVLKLHAEIGDRVPVGATLATLDAPDFGAAVSDLLKATADEQRKAQAARRAEQLLEADVIARRDAEGASADLAMARAESQRARQRLKNLDPSGRSDGGVMALRSPLAGVVVDRQINPGSEVRPDNPAPLFVVSNLEKLWLLVDLPERLLGQIKSGDKLSLRVDAYPDQAFAASVTRVGQALDPATRRIPLRALIDNRDGRLRPEMYARASLISDQGGESLKVPTGALFTQGLYSYVFVSPAPGQFERRRVDVAYQDAESAYLRPSGELGKDSKIVVKGTLLLVSELSAAD
ncbi:MAG TPA: efflux RND transporter periplasmic adaptor subunit [Rhodocyclaceae bacterium]